MHIVTVSYKELRSFGNYQNREAGAVAEVAPDGTPEAAYTALRAWVGDKLDAQEQMEFRQQMDRHEVSNLERRKIELEQDIVALQRRYEQAKAFLERAGIPVPERWRSALGPDGLPF